MSSLMWMIVDKANLPISGRASFNIVVRGKSLLTKEKVRHKMNPLEFGEIEAELLAPLRAENARLTAQVAAADAMRGRVAYAAGIASDGTWKVLTEALKAYDAATAPADAEPMNAMNAHSERIEQLVPLDPFRREWVRETEGILAKHEQRLDELAARVDGCMRIINSMRESYPKRLTALEAARQAPPPPTLSAPVEVTDTMATLAAKLTYSSYSAMSKEWQEQRQTEMRSILESVLTFAARDREVQG